MPIITLPKPGTKDGPCAGDCNHDECIDARNKANTECYLCNEKIGYDSNFFITDKGFCHEICYKKQLLREGKKGKFI